MTTVARARQALAAMGLPFHSTLAGFALLWVWSALLQLMKRTAEKTQKLILQPKKSIFFSFSNFWA
jgi:hypothetical protein